MKRRAILSVSDKTGIVELARGLVDLGYELVSTGGTFKTISEAGIPVRYVTEITGFPEILDGRVKTLHPMVHAGILARNTEEHYAELEKNNIAPIDLVVVNLYPFKQTISKPGVLFEEAIENIDIGGPTMVRAAAKNQERVTIVVNPNHYEDLLDVIREENEVPRFMRKVLATEAFVHTAEYDQMISSYLMNELAKPKGHDEQNNEQSNEQNIEAVDVFPPSLQLNASKVQDLRYGENPQQKAAFYRLESAEGTLAGALQLQGKELSYNNWMDMDAAWAIAQDFSDCACAIIKHTNPCGTALGKTTLEAYERALEVDPVSAFGGILAFNRVVDAECAKALREHFYEVIVAPNFSPEAKEILQEKKNLRLMVVAPGGEQSSPWKIRSIQGGLLVQEEDMGTTLPSDWEVVSDNKPSQEDLKELAFAWNVVKHVKSNAIVVTKDAQTLGVGAGQMNRVGSVKIALEEAGEKVKGAYLASDAFFPFSDSIEEAAKVGIKAIIQPGGSVKDAEVIEAAKRLGMIMVFTGRRHFKH